MLPEAVGFGESVYKKRSDYPLELEEAERILASLGMSAQFTGVQDAKSLLDHWHRCIHDLQKADLGDNHGGRADQENILRRHASCSLIVPMG